MGAAGLLRPFARHGDQIGLTGEARAEKQRIFPLPGHNRAANAEVMLWMAAAEQARAAGTYDPAIPVAVVTAGLAADWAGLPDGLRHGVIRLAAHHYRERDAASAAASPPAAVAALWRPWRAMRLA